MRENLIELIEDIAPDVVTNCDQVCPKCTTGCIGRLADYLLAHGVTILPEGAIILTRAEIDALNKYEEARKNEADKV